MRLHCLLSLVNAIPLGAPQKASNITYSKANTLAHGRLQGFFWVFAVLLPCVSGTAKMETSALQAYISCDEAHPFPTRRLYSSERTMWEGTCASDKMMEIAMGRDDVFMPVGWASARTIGNYVRWLISCDTVRGRHSRPLLRERSLHPLPVSLASPHGCALHAQQCHRSSLCSSVGVGCANASQALARAAFVLAAGVGAGEA